jgi:outer membrane lipoprotein-sorting protein
MNKNAVIVILILITLMSFVYAFFQQAAAQKAKEEAELNSVAAMEARMIADENAEMYRLENKKLIDSLQSCKGR